MLEALVGYIFAYFLSGVLLRLAWEITEKPRLLNFNSSEITVLFLIFWPILLLIYLLVNLKSAFGKIFKGEIFKQKD